MELLSARITISYKDKPPVLDDLRVDLQPGESIGSGRAQRLRQEFTGAGHPGACST